MSDLAPLRSLSDALASLVAAAAPSVVAIHAGRNRASGVVWRPGLIVTADEALPDEALQDDLRSEAGEVTVALPGGETVSARLAGRDPATDVALLRVERTDLIPAIFASGTAATTGALAVVVGSERGAPTAALGTVALAGPEWRSLRGGRIDARIELDLRLRRSAEGGLALGADGRALGLAVFGPRRRALVIPAATVERVATALERGGRVARGYLGLGLQPVRLDDGGAGAMVMSVTPGGPGAAAGLLMGDVVVAWDGAPAGRIAALVGALGPESVGTVVRLSVRRAGEAREVALTVGERPEA